MSICKMLLLARVFSPIKQFTMPQKSIPLSCKRNILIKLHCVYLIYKAIADTDLSILDDWRKCQAFFVVMDGSIGQPYRQLQHHQ